MPPPNAWHEDASWERIPLSESFGAVVGPVPRQGLRALERAVAAAGLKAYLQGHPVGRLELWEHLPGGAWGRYEPHSACVGLSLKRPKASWGQSWPSEGLPFAISNLAPSLAEARKRTLVHELGHHLWFTMGASHQQSFLEGVWRGLFRSVSRYGQSLEEEQFAEAFAAGVFEVSWARRIDPEGYAWMQGLSRRLGLEGC